MNFSQFCTGFYNCFLNTKTSIVFSAILKLWQSRLAVTCFISGIFPCTVDVEYFWSSISSMKEEFIASPLHVKLPILWGSANSFKPILEMYQIQFQELKVFSLFMLLFFLLLEQTQTILFYWWHMALTHRQKWDM